MLSVRGLCVDYKVKQGRVSVLQNVNLDFPKGKVTALIGESGSGKTTLTGTMLGLLAANAQVMSGEILFGPDNLLKLKPEQLRRFRWQRAAVVFQAAQGAWNPTMTIGKQMLDTAADHGEPLEASRQRRDMLLRQVRLEPGRIAAAYPHQLSGGMRQRALIAMSLMLEPELLILDEPTTALDLITQSYILDILAEIHKNTGITMILVTHDLAAVARLADHVAVLYAGTVVEVAEADQIFASPQHPYTQGLLNSSPGLSGALPGAAARAIEGKPPDLLNRPGGCIFAPRCPERVERCGQEVPLLGDKLVACHLR